MVINFIMNIEEADIEKMYSWIIKQMKFDNWYPVKSDKAFEIIVILFKEGLIDNCEFNENETHIRKINIDL